VGYRFVPLKAGEDGRRGPVRDNDAAAQQPDADGELAAASHATAANHATGRVRLPGSSREG
jgi:hypothetical protein